jgi:hypothetical protein
MSAAGHAAVDLVATVAACALQVRVM